MKVIYTYKNNIYAAHKAAYLHLKLDIDLIPKSEKELKAMNRNIKPYYLGVDEELNEIYIANSGRNTRIFTHVIEGFAHIYGEEVKIIDLK